MSSLFLLQYIEYPITHFCHCILGIKITECGIDDESGPVDELEHVLMRISPLDMCFLHFTVKVGCFLLLYEEGHVVDDGKGRLPFDGIPYIGDVIRFITVCHIVEVVRHLEDAVDVEYEEPPGGQVVVDILKNSQHLTFVLAIVEDVDGRRHHIKLSAEIEILHVALNIRDIPSTFLSRHIDHHIRLIHADDFIERQLGRQSARPAADVEYRPASTLELADDVEPQSIGHIICQFIIIVAEQLIDGSRLQHAHRV